MTAPGIAQIASHFNTSIDEPASIVEAYVALIGGNSPCEKYVFAKIATMIVIHKFCVIKYRIIVISVFQ